MNEGTQSMLCKALALVEQAIQFYDDTLASCSQSLGREVFAKLKEDKVGQIERVKAIHAGLVKGETWAQVCTLPPEDQADAHAVVKAFAAKYPKGACPASEKAALGVAIGMEDKILTFYLDQTAAALDPVEKEFMRRMSQETRAHFMLLKDTEYYFEDPESWHMGKERSGLDGA